MKRLTPIIAALALASLAPTAPLAAQADHSDEIAAQIAALAPELEVREGHAKPPALRALWTLVHRASRPGAGAERSRCAWALFAILRASAERPLTTRSELVHMLAIACDDAPSIARLAHLLGDPELAETALFALDRCAHPAAELQLIRYLDQPSALPRRALVAALGARRSRVAVAPLLALADGADTDLGRAARAALANIADPRSEAALRAALRRGERDAGEHLLRFHDRRLEEAQQIALEAARAYRGLLDDPDERVRLGALGGLLQSSSEVPFEALLERCGDPSPRIRAAVIAGLVHDTDPDLGARLVRAMEGATPLVHEGILRVLTARGEDSALLLVLLAAEESSTSVYPVAIELLGEFDDPVVEAVLIQAARAGVPAVRNRAASSLLSHARRIPADGERRAARIELLHTAIEAASDPGVLSGVIRELGELGSPSSLYHLDRWAADEAQSENVASARLAIARALPDTERKRAVELLFAVFEASSSRATRRAAARALDARGADVAKLAHRNGFLIAWKLMGPFPEAKAEDLGTHPFGPSGPSLEETIESGGRHLAWKELRTSDPDGELDLSTLEPSANVCAYAARVLDWPAAARVQFKLGSDDGAAVWVNGQLVHENFCMRGCSPDADVFPVELRKGANTILVKIHQGGGGWAFCLRVADDKGVPIDLR